MKILFQAFLAFCFLSFACRTSRPLVNILDDRSPSQLSPRNVPDAESTATSTLILAAVSTPPQDLDYDRLDLSLRETDAATTILYENYKLGEAIRLKPGIAYEISVFGLATGKKIYASSSCKKKSLKIHSQVGINRITAALCTISIPE